MGGGEEESPRTAKQEKGKTSYNLEDKGKTKYKEFTPCMKCFLCDGQHLAGECHKRNVLCALIKDREKEEEEACPSLIQMIGADES